VQLTRSAPVKASVTFEVDEEGEEFPPALCAVALVKNYGGDEGCEFNGMMVMVAGFDEFTQYIVVEFPTINSFDDPDRILCSKDELEPLNDFAEKLIESITDFPVIFPKSSTEKEVIVLKKEEQ
jgi:hypothetical protein